MRRDFDLVRQILLTVEAMPPRDTLQNLAYPDYDPETISEHVYLLIDAGLIRGEMIDLSGGDVYLIYGLTWDGHDFLEVAKDDTIWTKAKETFLKPTVSMTFDVLLQWLKEQAKLKLGLH